MAETHQPPEGDERRKIDPQRKVFTHDQQVGFIVRDRFGGVRPADLSYPANKFAEDGKAGEAVATAGTGLRSGITRLFDHLEGKIDVKKLEALKVSFLASLAPWEAAGLFSEERVKRGYRKPDFDADYKDLFGIADTDMMEDGEGLDEGYGRVVWTPEDVPVASDDPETLTFLKLAKEALETAYHGTAGGKQPNTLLVGPDKKVLTADQIDLQQILWQWERYKKPGIVYNPKELEPETHEGQTEAEMLASLRGTEKETGGVLRLERDKLIMPKYVRRGAMSGRDWHSMIKEGRTLPSNVRAQDAKQALAYIIHCLNTEGWIPDYFDYEKPEESRVALAPETYIPDESSAGAVPAFYWDLDYKRFRAGGSYADVQRTDYGVRGGVRKNQVTA